MDPAALRRLTSGATIAAAYLALTLAVAPLSFGIPIPPGVLQFRVAEALHVLAAVTPAAIPGLFIGCFLANLLNPQNLGPVDIIGGSLATLAAALATWRLRLRLIPLPGYLSLREMPRVQLSYGRGVIITFPAVLMNGLIVGAYLPFILPDFPISLITVAGSIVSLMLAEAVVVFGIGLPLLIALLRSRPVWMERWL